MTADQRAVCTVSLRCSYNTTMSTCGGAVWGPLIGDQLSAAHRVKSEVFPLTCACQTPGDTHTHTDFHTLKVITVWKQHLIARKRRIKKQKSINQCLAARCLIYLLLPIRALAAFAPVGQSNLPLFTNSLYPSSLMLESVCVLQPNMSCSRHTKIRM